MPSILANPKNPEIENLDRDQQFVRNLYASNLRRQPTENDVNYWINRLNTGHTAQDIFNEISQCEEALLFRNERLFTYPGHFYSPIVAAHEAVEHLDRHIDQRPMPETLSDIDISPAKMRVNWQELLPFMRTNPFPVEKSDAFRYCFNNDSFGYGDGYVLNAMIRKFRPKRFVEIGCGWSSACTLDTIGGQLDSPCSVTFVEPYPALLHKLVGAEADRCQIFPVGVQLAPLEIFEALEANDILFIDSTHILKTGSDVHFELFEILPRLKKGVIVHFHDIFWPFKYPRQWVIDDNRTWNELYGLRAFLSDNPTWDIFMFNDYISRVLASDAQADFPDFLRNAGGSLWMIKR